jgi:hypothetical protein
MDEAYLKGRLVKTLREAMPGAVVTRHEDKLQAGIPDISVAWRGITSWVEVKHWRRGRPSRLTALQNARLHDLRSSGVPAYCLTYYEYPLKRTALEDRPGHEVGASGYDHEWAAETIRSAHLRPSLVDDVRAFHVRFGVPARVSPIFDADFAARRFAHLQEETEEFRRAVLARSLPDAADALVDLVYVALGGAVGLGLPWQELWDDVHRANMEKVREEGDDFKYSIRKPKGWRGPDTKRILSESVVE